MEIVNLMSFVFSTFGNDRFNFVRHPDVGLNIEQQTQKYGYPLETHRVQTEDGYFLTTHRIPYGRFSNQTNPHPALLVHGTCGSADTFLAIEKENLAYFLADRGFDVWMMNDRGNKYSRKHKYLNPNTNKLFWEYSWHEISVYDIPVNIDYILKVTNRDKLTYIGHSQGTTQYFVLLSEKPEYNEKINVGVQLAPSASYKYTSSLNKVLAKNHRLLQDVMDSLGVYELFPNELNDLIIEIGKFICSDQNVFVDVCNLLFQFGNDSGQMGGMGSQLLLNAAPARCAVKQLTHYFQVIHSGIFRQYDHGAIGNFRKYGSEVPRNYSFSRITAPTIYLYGELDSLCPVQDVEHLISLTKRAEAVRIPNFNHIDFISGKDAQKWAFEPMFQLLQKYLE